MVRGNRLEDFIFGSNPCPPATVTTTSGSEPNPKFEEWIVTDQLLLGWLYNLISVDIAIQLINCKKNRELWCNIEEMAGATTKANELWFKGELQRTRKGSMKNARILGKNEIHCR